MRKASVIVALLCGVLLLIVAATVATAAEAGPELGNLASTSTEPGHAALAVLGMVLLAAGVVLLRRPAVVPTR